MRGRRNRFPNSGAGRSSRGFFWIAVTGVAGSILKGGCVYSQELPVIDAGDAVLSEELRIDGYAANLVPIGSAAAVGASRLAVREDGEIAVVQPIDAGVRFFGFQGDAIASFGRSGSGPGDFLTTVGLGWTNGDTLWIYDGQLRRMTLVSPQRSLGRTVRIPMEAVGGLGDDRSVTQLGSVYPIGMPTSEEFLAVVSPSGSDERVLVQMRHDGTVTNVFTTLPDTRMSVRTREGGTFMVPFPNRVYYRASPNARRVGFVAASLEGEWSGTFLLTVWNVADASLAFSRRYPFDPVPIPPALADSVIEFRASRMFPENRETFRAVGAPPVFPPLDGLVLGRDGTTWIRLSRSGADGRQSYFVVDSSGDPIGTLEVPEQTIIAAAERGRIWAIVSDEVGVESIVRYSVTWTSSE